MAEIQRFYAATDATCKSRRGKFVLYDDYVADKAAAVKKLEAENKTLRTACQFVVEAFSATYMYDGKITGKPSRCTIHMYDRCKQALEEK